MGNIMVGEHSLRKMGKSMLENGRMVEKTVKEQTFSLMEVKGLFHLHKCKVLQLISYFALYSNPQGSQLFSQVFARDCEEMQRNSLSLHLRGIIWIF